VSDLFFFVDEKYLHIMDISLVVTPFFAFRAFSFLVSFIEAGLVGEEAHYFIVLSSYVIVMQSDLFNHLP
jgi:hypothetical protein